MVRKGEDPRMNPGTKKGQHADLPNKEQSRKQKDEFDGNISQDYRDKKNRK
jgi:hypothetical protein